MQELYNKLKQYSLKDAIEIEKEDRQFISLKKLWDNFTSDYNKKDLYLFLIITNSLICYQLSGKGEDYWEEFGNYFTNKNINKNNVLYELKIFLKQSEYNKRFIEGKIKRINKLEKFIDKFYGKAEYYYNDMINLRNELAIIMNQKKDAKTIVFAIKMFSYGARNIFGFVEFPKDIFIPIDSRLTNLFEIYRPHPNPLLIGEGTIGKNKKIKDFYKNLGEKLNIPMLHLDGIVWTKYEELIKK